MSASGENNTVKKVTRAKQKKRNLKMTKSVATHLVAPVRLVNVFWNLLAVRLIHLPQ